MSGLGALPEPALFDIELPQAPYPGLRPFERHEWPIFFGREPMTHDAITRLLDQNLVVVHGDSGCGKSSLIRAGVLVQLEQQYERGGFDWRTCAMLPREAPLWRLAEALAGCHKDEPVQDLVRQIRRALNAGRGAAAKLEQLLCPRPRDRVCILVDQFEELFRFARETSADEARLFVEVLVGLLEEAATRHDPKSELPPLRIYAILTMRSEFLGVCARFTGLAEAVNRTQYLLPQMDRPALLRAIREPAALYDGEVSRALAERLIADAGGGQDQLPLIQHGLMRLWRKKAAPSSAEPPAQLTGLAEARGPVRDDNVLSDASVPFRHRTEQELVPRPGHEGDDVVPPPSYRHEGGPAWRLDLEDYRGGSLAALLSEHADQVMADAAPDARRAKIVEHLFRALTDINAEGSAVRRPQTLGRLAAVTGCEDEVATLKDIVDRFRADGVSFLSPYGDAPIAPDTPIDISHEALIRRWKRIADEKEGWLQREFRDGLIWKSLRLQAEEGGTLSAVATSIRDEWLKTLPSEHWCERYDGGWADVQQLMERSRSARDEEERRRQELEESKRREAEERARRAEEAEQAAARLAEVQERIANEQRQRAEAEQQRAAEADARAREAEAARWRSKRMALVVGVFGLLALCAALGAGWMSWRATLAEARAEFGNSFYRGVLARNELEHAGPVTAMQIALAGLPDDPEKAGAGPWVSETAGALVEALGAQRELKVLRGHEDSVWAAGFSPDGARIVSGSNDNTVRVWDAASGKELLVLRGHEQPVIAAEFSPDGARIISGSAETVRVWDAASGKELLVLRDRVSSVWTVAFSPDGTRIVIGSYDNTVRVWDAASGEEQSVLRGHQGPVNDVAFSPDGMLIVSGSEDRTVRVWDAVSGTELSVLRSDDGIINSVAFSPDGARIVSGSDFAVKVWDPESETEVLVLRGHEDTVYAASFSPDAARIVSGSHDKTVRVWDAASGNELLVLRGHEGPVYAASFSPDAARIVSGSRDTIVRMWDAGSVQELLVLRGHQDRVRAVSFSPDGARIVSGAFDNTVRVWDAASGKELLVLRGHEDWIRAAAFSPDGARIVSGSADQMLLLWDTASGKELLVLGGLEGEVRAAGFSPDGARVVSGSDDSTVRVWDAASGEGMLVMVGHEDRIRSASFSPDGARVVSGSDDKTVRVWDAASGNELLVLRGHEGPVYAASFSPDSARIVSGSEDGTVREWDARSGAKMLVVRAHRSAVWAASFSPDGARVVSGSEDGTVRVWDAASGQELLVLRGHEGPVLAAGFSPDGARIVSGSVDNTVRVTWIGRSRQELIETARARLPRELTEEEKRRFYLTTN